MKKIILLTIFSLQLYTPLSYAMENDCKLGDAHIELGADSFVGQLEQKLKKPCSAMVDKEHGESLYKALDLIINLVATQYAPRYEKMVTNGLRQLKKHKRAYPDSDYSLDVLTQKAKDHGIIP